MIEISKYAQRDPRWGGLQLGKSGLLCKDYGCTSVVSASALGVNPISFISEMSAGGGYTPDGLLIWKVAGKLYNSDCWISPTWDTSPADLNKIKSFVSKGYPVVVETRFPVGKTSRDSVDNQHWLIILDENLTIYDPWYNKTELFTQTYGDPSRWIYSARCFQKAPEDKLMVPKATFEALVDKSTKYDAMVAQGFVDPQAVKTTIRNLEQEIGRLNNDLDLLRQEIQRLSAELAHSESERNMWKGKFKELKAGTQLESIKPLVTGWINYLRNYRRIREILGL